MLPSPLSPAVVTISVALAVVTTAVGLVGLFSEWACAAEAGNRRLQTQAQDLGNLLAMITAVSVGTLVLVLRSPYVAAVA